MKKKIKEYLDNRSGINNDDPMDINAIGGEGKPKGKGKKKEKDSGKNQVPWWQKWSQWNQKQTWGTVPCWQQQAQKGGGKDGGGAGQGQGGGQSRNPCQSYCSWC